MTVNGEVRIGPLTPEELARIPPTPQSTDEERREALKARHDREQEFLARELEHARYRIRSQNVEVQAPWRHEIQMYDRTLCMCGELLAILTEGEEPIRKQKIGDKIVLTKLAIPHATPEHTIFNLVMDDGSAHQTVTCKKCAKAALDGEANLERYYVYDLAKWLTEPGGTVIAARYGRRKPLFAVSLDVEERK